MEIMNNIKKAAQKLMNGGFTPIEMVVSQMMGITPEEYRALCAKKALEVHVSPLTGRRCETHFHNSKYLPDGTEVIPGTVVTDYKIKQMKSIIAHNRLVPS